MFSLWKTSLWQGAGLWLTLAAGLPSAEAISFLDGRANVPGCPDCGGRLHGLPPEGDFVYAATPPAAAAGAPASNVGGASQPAERPKAAVDSDGRLKLTFRHLAFELPPEALTPDSAGTRGYGAWLPEAIKAYDGRTVTITGYMLPTQFENGLVTECLILANQGACCYGKTPKFYEFIVARMVGKPAMELMDRPVTFTGTLRVGDVFADDFWVTLYTLECTEAGR